MNTARVEALCSRFGVSSAESIVGKLIKENQKPFCDRIVTDRLGSSFAWKQSKNENAKIFMIASPLDEIGFMISEVKQDGTLAFIALENVAVTSLLHQRVRILTRNGEYVDGVIGISKKALEDKCEVKSTEDLAIECGLGYETIKGLIRPGDLASYGNNFSAQNQSLMSKALFPRVLNEVTIALLEKIRDEEFDFHLAVGCVAQSIIGYRGTKTATYVIKPDAAIALTVFDTAGKKVNPGDGVIVGYYDKQMLPSQLLLKDIQAKMGAKPYFGAMGNDGSFIHKTLTGTPAISLGIAMANVGSANEICSAADVDTLTDALYQYLKSIDSQKIAEFGFGDLND